MSHERETDIIDRVRRFTGLSEEEVTDELILSMDGAAEQRSGRIILYRKGKVEEGE